MNRIKSLLINILSFPKTLYFNFKCFSFHDAVKLPILVSWNTKIERIDGHIILDNVTPRQVRIGFGGSFGLGGVTYLSILGNLHFKGNASFGRGTQIIVNKAASLTFGNNFWGNCDCIYNSSCKIVFGDDCLLGWRIAVLDGDGHKLYDQNTMTCTNDNREIIIGNHVWICPETTVLKGSLIADDSVIATKSVVSKRIDKKSVLIKDNNIIKENVMWEL